MLKPIFSPYRNKTVFHTPKKKVNHPFKYSSTRNISPRRYIGWQRLFLNSAKKSDERRAKYKKKKKVRKANVTQRRI